MVIKLTKKGVLLLFSWNKKGFYDGVCNCRHDNEQACRDIGILEEKKTAGWNKRKRGTRVSDCLRLQNSCIGLLVDITYPIHTQFYLSPFFYIRPVRHVRSEWNNDRGWTRLICFRLRKRRNRCTTRKCKVPYACAIHLYTVLLRDSNEIDKQFDYDRSQPCPPLMAACPLRQLALQNQMWLTGVFDQPCVTCSNDLKQVLPQDGPRLLLLWLQCNGSHTPFPSLPPHIIVVPKWLVCWPPHR